MQQLPESPQPADFPTSSQAMLRGARRLQRRKERGLARRFLAEGRQAISEALRRPGAVIELIAADDSVDRHRDLVNAAGNAGVRTSVAPSRAVAELAATVTPQGLVAVCQMIDVTTDQALAGTPRLVVLCDQVRDPGNLGTVIRCADAFGADAVLVSEDSVDVYNAKTVRATAGSLFHLPLAIGVSVAAAIIRARESGLQIFGTDAAARHTINDLAESGELAGPILWVMGNEAWGLQPQHRALVDRLVALPLYGQAESLNLSTAAAIFLYASATAQRVDGSTS